MNNNAKYHCVIILTSTFSRNSTTGDKTLLQKKSRGTHYHNLAPKPRPLQPKVRPQTGAVHLKCALPDSQGRGKVGDYVNAGAFVLAYLYLWG